MDRKNLIEAVEKSTNGKIKELSWIYGISGENCGDGEDLYFYDVTLQLIFSSGKFISVTANNYCTDRSRVLETTLGSFEIYGIVSDSYDLSEDLETMLFDYLETYGDELEKPRLDRVFFESM